MSRRLNLHIDESGNQNLSEGRYLVCIVLHEHDQDILSPIQAYEERLAIAALEDVPFHGKDLLHGNEQYRVVSAANRRRLLSQFARLVRSLPFSYFMLRYDVANTHNQAELGARIRRDLAAFVFNHLAYFQSFGLIAVYYDDGQKVVSSSLHDALDFVLAKNVAQYRDADHMTRRLLQVADYICTVERAAMAYDLGQQTKTQERFFGTARQFKQSYLKLLRGKRFD